MDMCKLLKIVMTEGMEDVMQLAQDQIKTILVLGERLQVHLNVIVLSTTLLVLIILANLIVEMVLLLEMRFVMMGVWEDAFQIVQITK